MFRVSSKAQKEVVIQNKRTVTGSLNFRENYTLYYEKNAKQFYNIGGLYMSIGTIGAAIAIIGMTVLLELNKKDYEEKKKAFENE